MDINYPLYHYKTIFCILNIGLNVPRKKDHNKHSVNYYDFYFRLLRLNFRLLLGLVLSVLFLLCLILLFARVHLFGIELEGSFLRLNHILKIVDLILNLLILYFLLHCYYHLFHRHLLGRSAVFLIICFLLNI